MIKTFFLSLSVLLLIGCSTHQDVDFTKETHKKAFEQEDTYILYALYAEEKKEYSAAAGLFEMLYRSSGKDEYKYRELTNYSLAGDYQALLKQSALYIEKDSSDFKVRRYEVLGLIATKKFDLAKEKALVLVEESKAPEDYLLVSEIYIKEKHYDTAIKYLESAYVINYDEAILDQMAVILYVNLNRKADAIAQLETHSRLHSCSKRICMRLGSFYSQENNLEGMLSTYLRLYENDPSDEVGEAIIRIYTYQKDERKLFLFLQKSRMRDSLLLQLYIEKQLYTKAATLAKELYEKKGEVTYLGQSAIFSYESAEDKHDKLMLKEVMKNLKKVIHEKPTPLFLNYLGYLMIDHDIDVIEGIKYVNRALELDPESAFYLDSLAWGYYRQNRCSEALEIMQKVTNALGDEDEEVKMHLDAINKCLKKEI
jgi:tetratricopeptide (TPR) repeat protein